MLLHITVVYVHPRGGHPSSAVQCNQRLGMLLSPCMSSTHDMQSYGSAFTVWLVYRFDEVSNTRCGQTGLYSIGDSVSRDLKPRLCSC